MIQKMIKHNQKMARSQYTDLITFLPAVCVCSLSTFLHVFRVSTFRYTPLPHIGTFSLYSITSEKSLYLYMRVYTLTHWWSFMVQFFPLFSLPFCSYLNDFYHFFSPSWAWPVYVLYCRIYRFYCPHPFLPGIKDKQHTFYYFYAHFAWPGDIPPPLSLLLLWYSMFIALSLLYCFPSLSAWLFHPRGPSLYSTPILMPEMTITTTNKLL